MELGLLLPVLLILIFIYKVIWSLLEARKAARSDDTGNYRNYDATDYERERWSGFVPYDSYEFAGVRGAKRAHLEQSRAELLEKLSPVPHGVRIWNLVVIPKELFDRDMTHLVSLRWDMLLTGIVVLKDGRRYLCFFDGYYITAVEGSPAGIPFSLEEIDKIEETDHWVTVKTIEERQGALKQSGLLDRIITGRLDPGNY